MANQNLSSSIVRDTLNRLIEAVKLLDFRLVAFSAAITSLVLVLHRVFFHSLAGIPGPRFAAVCGLWRTYFYARGTWHDDVLALHNTYGRVVRVAPNEVSVVDVGAMKRLYGHGHNARKTTWYTTWQIKGATTAFFAEQEPKIHAALRRRVSAAYSMSAILRFEKYIQACLDLCFSKLEGQAEAGNIVEFSDWTNALTFDVVGELGFGQQLGHLRTESDVNGLREMIRGGFKAASVLGHIPGQVRLLTNPLATSIAHLFGVENNMQKFLLWSSERVSARRSGKDGAEREDMLSHFMKMKSLDGAQQATNDEVLIEAMNIM